MNFLLTLTALAMISTGSPAWAATYDFTNITHNGSLDVSRQLTVEVTDHAGYATFVFKNNGPTASNVTEIYFDNLLSGLTGVVTGFKSLVNGSGVFFSTSYNLAPSNLPGGNNLTPSFTSDWGIDSANGTAMGINPNEWLALGLFTNGSVIGALSAGSLRIGMHVRSIGPSASSDSFVSRIPDTASTFALLNIGLGALGMVVRRRKA